MITIHPSIHRLMIILACTLALSACATPPPATVEADPAILRVGGVAGCAAADLQTG